MASSPGRPTRLHARATPRLMGACVGNGRSSGPLGTGDQGLRPRPVQGNRTPSPRRALLAASFRRGRLYPRIP